MSYVDENGITWYKCATCGYWFPGSEASEHKGHKYS